MFASSRSIKLYIITKMSNYKSAQFEYFMGLEWEKCALVCAYE